MSKPHKKLVAWQKSMDLVEKIYPLSKRFPRDEVYGLTSQVRRPTVAVPSNIAERAAGRSSVHFSNYLSVAIGALNELDTQLEIAQRIGYVDGAAVSETEALVDECLAVYGLRRSLQ